MPPPRLFLDQPADAAEIVGRFSTPKQMSETSYATVRDYCESLDYLPHITGVDGDLKNVQRPWTVKALLRAVPPPARLLEIGGGEPIVTAYCAAGSVNRASISIRGRISASGASSSSGETPVCTVSRARAPASSSRRRGS